MSAGLTSVRVTGGLLPSDILTAVLAGDLDGLNGSAYHLGSETPREASARVWTHLLGVYRRFRTDLASLPEDDPAVGLTRERWLMLVLSELGYGRVPLTPAGGLTVDGKQYPVSHLWGSTPIHLLGWGVSLDRRTPGVPGAAQRAPHAMVQELLNRTDDYLWAMVSNGRLLRLLRDSTTLTGQAFVEFDLESMFDGELYSEFTLLFLLCHQSRVEVPPDAAPSDCWLERWRTTAVSQGVRALNLLRDGVQQTLETLGTGFLQHPANNALRERLGSGEIRLADIHAALLRLAYRLLFWAVAEDRDALLNPDATKEQRERYDAHFSSSRLRRFAMRRHGSGHDDIWQAVSLVLDALGQRDGEARLGLPGLGGLFTPTAADVLAGNRLPNTALLASVRSLAIVQPKGQPRRLVDFAHLGPEELGSIYESLLELVPRLDPTTHTFTLENLAGNDRKTSGSYYTPTDLVDLVLDTALDPVLDDAEKGANTAQEAETALLAVRVCDPAVGSAHFLVSAARRIATRLATVRTGEVDPTPSAYSDALHDVVARCVYGVDINPMAADLAKVSLWLTAMSPGRPLSFLDHHIKVGNALLGATPALLHSGIPDAAYVALTGDDKQVAASWRKRNAAERAGQGDLFDDAGVEVDLSALRTATVELGDRAAAATTVDEVAWAAQRYADLQADPDTVRARRVADAWCAAFLGPKTADAEPITQRTLTALAEGTAPDRVVSAVDEIASRHRLFHWHLEFPDIFTVPEAGPGSGPYGWTGGFLGTAGNPPWDALQMSEKEFFATRDTSIADAATAAARKRLIAELETTDPALFAEFSFESRRGQAETSFLRGSGRFPLCGTGKVNTYSVFAEHFRATLAPHGRSGIITPTGLATDATTAAFFADTVAAQRLAAFYDFENEARIFEGVHNQFRFAISCMTGGERVADVRMAFYTRHVRDVPSRRFALAADEVLLLNPNTGTLPVFRTRRDAEVTLACYRRHPVLIRDNGGNPWSLRFSQGLFNMASDSGLFRTAEELRDQGATYDGWSWTAAEHRWLPLYEAKMLSHWNSRHATYADATQAQLNKGTLPRLDAQQLDDPHLEPLAHYWVEEAEVRKAVPQGWDRHYLLGWRDIAGASNVRTFVPSVLPLAPVGHKFPLALPADPAGLPLLHAVWSSLVFDYIVRQKVSGASMTYTTVRQLACPEPAAFRTTPAWCDQALGDFVRMRVLELAYNSDRLAPYASDVLKGTPRAADPGEPFRWVPERREQLKAELEAAMMLVYGLERSDAEHVIDSFFVVRKYEERDLGEFRTKRLVLAAYDAMTTAAITGVPYSSPLDPPPGEGPRHPRELEHHS